ncbi:uncharacterized protein [Dermacentor albipictus]
MDMNPVRAPLRTPGDVPTVLPPSSNSARAFPQKETIKAPKVTPAKGSSSEGHSSDVPEGKVAAKLSSEEEQDESKNSSEQDDTEATSETADVKFGVMLCMIVITLCILIGVVVITLSYRSQESFQVLTTSPVLPKIEDFEVSEKPTNKSSQPGEPEEGKRRLPYLVRFAKHPSANTFPWMEGCSTPACLAIRHRLLGAIEPFMNPCRNLNYFSCSVGERRSLVDQEEEAVDEGPGEAAVPGAERPVQFYRAPHRLVRGRGPRIQADGKSLKSIMIRTCYLYSETLRNSLDVLPNVTQYFNLNFPNVVFDPNEDPVERMLQLSLEYGLHPIVSFVRRFRYTRDPSEPFELQIDITERARHYFKYWNEHSSEGFYNKTLVPLGQQPTDKDELSNGDMLISEIVKEDVDPVTNETNQDILEQMNISALASYTEDNITADRWKQLLVQYGRSPFELHDEVYANRRALAVLGHFARTNERTSMRRMLAFHLGLLLLDPKEQVIKLMNGLRKYESASATQLTKESVCKKYADETFLFPGGVMSITLPEFEIPVERLRKVGTMMANIMDSLVAIGRQPVRARHNITDLGPAFDYPASAMKAGSVYLLDGVDSTENQYLYVWLRELRIRHAQPPIIQAALEAMRHAGDQPVRLYQRFRPPYFYEDGLGAYNYATLGQILAQGAVQELASATSPDMEKVKAHWRTFWDKRAATDFNAAYCLQANRQKAFMEPPVASLNESAMGGVSLQRAMGARLAYFTWQRQRGSGSEGLPKLYLAPKVLFFVQHCILGCSRMGPMGSDTPDDGCAVLMRDWGSIGERVFCKRDALNLPQQRCRYI